MLAPNRVCSSGIGGNVGDTDGGLLYTLSLEASCLIESITLGSCWVLASKSTRWAVLQMVCLSCNHTGFER